MAKKKKQEVAGVEARIPISFEDAIETTFWRLLCVEITELYLPERLEKALANAKIVLFGDLVLKTKAGLAEIKGVGKANVRRIEGELTAICLEYFDFAYPEPLAELATYSMLDFALDETLVTAYRDYKTGLTTIEEVELRT